MRLGISVSAVLIVLLPLATPAAARPAEGGRYVGDVSFAGDRCRNCVRLVVANDGKELQRSTAVDLTRTWRWNRSCDAQFSFYTWTLDDPYRVQIRDDGTFSRKIRYLPRQVVRIAGRFSGDGRRVRGTLSVRSRRPGCRMRATMRLKARLVGRPQAPVAGRWARCDPYEVGRWPREAWWDVYDLDVGCTTAREAARAWLTDPACQNLTVGTSCTAGRLLCGPVDRGERAPPDQVRCVLPDISGPAVELLQTQHCGDEDGIQTWTKNVPCAQALAIRDAFFFEDNQACRDEECTVDGYSCRLEDGTDTSFIYRCRSGDRSIAEFRVSG
jgi:hypothetical protein